MPARGEAARQFTSDPAQDRTPSWSPDGQHVAFNRRDSCHTERSGSCLQKVARRVNSPGTKRRRVVTRGRVAARAASGRALLSGCPNRVVEPSRLSSAGGQGMSPHLVSLRTVNRFTTVLWTVRKRMTTSGDVSISSDQFKKEGISFAHRATRLFEPETDNWKLTRRKCSL